MQKVYKIDESQLGSIKKRAIFRFGKIMLFTLPIAYVPLILGNKGESAMNLLIPFIFTSALIVFIVYLSLNKLATSYKSMEIVLNDDGVEFKAEMMPFKKISWQNLKMKEKSDGVITLYDMNISAFNRMMYGKGCILVQPEIINRLDLLNELQKRIYHG